MLIEINKSQYEDLIWSIQISGFIYGLLRDMVSQDYNEKLSRNEELENYLLGFAKEYGQKKIVEEFDGKNVATHEYLDKVLDDMSEYEDYIMWDELSSRLGARDFYQQHSKKELKKMTMQEILTKRFEFEEKYYKEFEENGLDRLGVNEKE
ncbi:MAG: hypothetical protein NTX00_02360 [Candidatus Parcubacteria bacterium]|nr:hypothetical protein [Candidatus Parcubacteria bacterium]